MTCFHLKPHRRGSVIIIVIWAIAVAAIITSSVQLFSFRQATTGRESIERVQARWAARAGMEATIAVMTDHTVRPYDDDAKAMARDMYFVSSGTLLNAKWDIQRQVDGTNLGGPMDEHSKLNLNNTADQGVLLSMEDMTLDVLDAMRDWLDADSDAGLLGVERDYYLSMEPSPYLPRNGPMRSVGEMELIAGVWPKYFRGEDWNFNNRLDPNENDAGRSFPPDDSDNILNAGWFANLTVYSVVGGATNTGLPRIRLSKSTVEELTERLEISDQQAQTLMDFGKGATNVLSDLLTLPFGGGGVNADDNGNNANNGGNNSGNNNNQGQNGNNNQSPPTQPGQTGDTPPLDEKQLRAVLAECIIENPMDRKPGKMNLNTVPAEFMRRLLSDIGLDEAIADEIIHMRNSKPQGITSVVDLRKIPNITSDELKALTTRFDTVSNVFTISSRGRSFATGLEIEIVAVVDRSTVPARIIEYREQ